MTARHDFETYSEAGYRWDETDQKWRSLPTSKKRGLKAVGRRPYVEHPTCDVLCYRYKLPGMPLTKHWRPGLPVPLDLCAYIANGGVLEAWNAPFERGVWDAVMVKRYGFPPLPLRQQRCAMGRARAFSLPGSLDLAGKVTGAAVQKDKRGAALLKKFSQPRNPTKTDPRRRILPAFESQEAVEALYRAMGYDPAKFPRGWYEKDHADALALDEYCATDVESEEAVSAMTPELEGEELEFWFADQAIIDRGVQVDVEGVRNCIAIIEQAHSLYNEELRRITGGEITDADDDEEEDEDETVQSASKVKQLIQWLGRRGVELDKLDEETVSLTLERTDLSPQVRRVLEIRALIGSASVKKVYAMLTSVTSAGRSYDLFNYHAARTGRVTGEGAQPTNMPNSGPGVMRCGCGRHFRPKLASCPWCGIPVAAGREPVEWGFEAARDALEIIATRSLRLVEHIMGDAMAVVSGCLRLLFCAAPGHDLVSADYSSIEAVVLAMLSGCQWRIDVFRTHGKIYEMSAARMFGVPLEEILEHKKRTGDHHPLRKLGKVAELACFAPDTQVLTRRGYVRIVDVLPNDFLWDGVEWVTHGGVISKGNRSVLSLDGARMTPDHKIFCGSFWREAKQLVSSQSTLRRALETGSANLPSCASKPGSVSSSPAHAAPRRTTSPSAISGVGDRPVVMPALKSSLSKHGRSGLPTRTQCLTTNTAADSSTDWRQQSVDATTSQTLSTPTTEEEVSASATSGGETGVHSCATSRLYRDGMYLPTKWTGPTWTGGTSLGISASSPDSKTCSTNAPCKTCSDGSTSWSDVYDIANAGPRNRFTIKTNTGHLIVHNCGYLGWVNAAKQFNMPGTDAEIKANIKKWRKASPEIVELGGGQSRGWFEDSWPELFGIEGTFIKAMREPGVWHPVLRADGSDTRIAYYGTPEGTVFCELPSGRRLTYHRCELKKSTRPYAQPWEVSISYEGFNTNPKNGPRGWIRMSTYAGKLLENVVQATARDILRFAIINLERAGYAVVLHVYDEIVSEIMQGWGSIEEFVRIMGTMPAWAADWPIKVGGPWRGGQYRK